MWFSKKKSPAEVFGGLRAQALDMDPASGGMVQSPAYPNVWAVLVEIGYPAAVATVVAFADGTTSLYLSSGGGVIGGGERASVKAASAQLFRVAEAVFAHMPKAETTPLPTPGRVRLYVRTYTDTRTAEASEAECVAKTHAMWPMFFAAHAVIGALREASSK